MSYLSSKFYWSTLNWKPELQAITKPLVDTALKSSLNFNLKFDYNPYYPVNYVYPTNSHLGGNNSAADSSYSAAANTLHAMNLLHYLALESKDNPQKLHPEFIRVRQLLLNKINLEVLSNEFSSEGSTPLALALLSGDKNFVKWMIDHGAKPNLRNKNGETALLNALNIILSKARQTHQVRLGESLLTINSYLETFNVWLTAGGSAKLKDVKGNSALSLAAQSYSLNMTQRLLIGMGDAAINDGDLERVTPLMKVVRVPEKNKYCESSLVCFNQELQLQMTRWLLKNKANPAAIDINGRSVLDYAKANSLNPELAKVIQAALAR